MTCQFKDSKMIDTHCKIKIWNIDIFEDTYCQTGCPLKLLINIYKGDVE